MFADLKFAFRQLAKSPGFTLVAVLTFALGIGACTAMFSVVNAVLLRPLPFREPARLVWLENGRPGATLSHRTLPADHFLEWREQTRSFEALAAYHAFFDLKRYAMTGSGEAQRLRGVQVSRNFLDVLGVQPALGRGFLDEECVENGRPAAILTHAFWLQKFGGAANVIGRTVTVNDLPVEIVGVLPASANLDALFSPGNSVELLLPLPLSAELARQGNTLFGIGRLKPGATLAQAQEELTLIDLRLQAAHPAPSGTGGTDGTRVTGLEDHIRGPFRPAFLILSGAVLCVLLIACVNLSNLLLARANARRQEFSVRIALGASRWHLVRQTMAESLLLASVGYVLGLIMAAFGTAPLAGLQTFSIPLLQTTTVDATALAVTIGLTVFAGCLCGVLPALQLWRRDAHETLSATGARGGTSRGTTRVRQSLVIAEIALACVLLVGAGLLLRSFVAVLQVDLGFQPHRVVAWRVDPPRTLAAGTERDLYLERLAQRISSVPGVESVGLSDTLPLGYKRAWTLQVKGVAYGADFRRWPVAYVRMVDRGYLDTMRIPLRAGRDFNDRDTATSPKAMLVSETMARNLWSGRDPLGQTVTFGEQRDYVVVGVVSDVLHGLEDTPQPDMYLNLRQTNDWQPPELVVRASRDPAALIPDVRAAMQEFDPALASNEFTTLDQIVDRAIAPRRLIAGLLGAFSSLALLLAALGLYGVIAYSITQRTREIGIRLALGAQRGDMLQLVVGEGLRLAGLGVVVGLIGAYFVTRVLQSQLHGVTASDPLTYLIIAAVLVAIALLACWFPARRATRVDPLTALRAD